MWGIRLFPVSKIGNTKVDLCAPRITAFLATKGLVSTKIIDLVSYE